MRVLQVLAQQPAHTGSGVTIRRLVENSGWEHCALVGVPMEADPATLLGMSADRVHAVRFGGGDLPFAVPGMSDVMPYKSRRYSSLSTAELDRYISVWTEHVRRAISTFRPDVVHCHHLWLVASIATSCDVPVVLHCHGTGLRQMVLCPEIRDRVVPALPRAKGICALHGVQREAIAAALSVSESAIDVVGAGFDPNRFAPSTNKEPRAVVFAGKIAAAKGLDWLLEAVSGIDVTLSVAGGGQGAEADRLRARMKALGARVIVHGRLEQSELATVLGEASVFVLPSLFEGLPLVLLEAAASGCRVVATELPGVSELASALGDSLIPVKVPPLTGPDKVADGAGPAFAADIRSALQRAVELGPPSAVPPGLSDFTWGAVTRRVEAVWRRACEG